jgi:hypothetical protein
MGTTRKAKKATAGCDRCVGRHLLPADFMGVLYDPKSANERNADDLITRLLAARGAILAERRDRTGCTTDEINARMRKAKDARSLLARLEQAVVGYHDDLGARQDVLLDALTSANAPEIGQGAQSLRDGAVSARRSGFEPLRVKIARSVIKQGLPGADGTRGHPLSDEVIGKAVTLWTTRMHGKSLAVLALADALECGPAMAGYTRDERAEILRVMLQKKLAARSTKP